MLHGNAVNVRAIFWILGLVAIGLSVFSQPTLAASECNDLPASRLRVYSILSNVNVDYHDDMSTPGHMVEGAIASHPYLGIAVRTGFQLVFDGTTVVRGEVYCAAPHAIQVGIGIVRLTVVLPPAAGIDACVRDALLRHAALHTDALADTTRTIVGSTRNLFGRSFAMLKTKPATTAVDAQSNFDKGVREVVNRAVLQFKSKLDDASAAVDTWEELSILRTTCDGRIEQLGQIRAALPGSLRLSST